MTSRFFSKPVWLFGNVAIMILCAVFFLVPFALRGARMAVQDIRNEVTDWLPEDFPETQVLKWFRPRFVGDQFVAISWDGCSRGEPAYDALVAKLQAESVEGQKDLPPKLLEIKTIADRLALQQTDEKYHSNWGLRGERWLLGAKGQWYYITKKGELFRWTGKNNAFSTAQRGITQFLYGGIEVNGERVVEIDPDPKYYEDPKLLCSRFFKSIQSGPEILQQLIGEEGPLKSLPNAELEAHKRLTGSLFGPTPSVDFEWSQEGFLRELTPRQLAELPENVEQEFQKYVDDLVANPDPGGKYDYNGDIDNLKKASQEQKLEHWYNFFRKIGRPMPPRQTAIMVVLNTPVLGELNRVVGREILGKPAGRIRFLANHECDISKEDLHLGGPPCDNVAIDEEGTITLVRLVGFSSLIGLVIAYVSFRSVLVTMMVFFVGGVSAIASMGIVWYANSQLDAILLTMPSLVYVLGLSGAVHIVNYYREACHDNGHRTAAETAVKYGWFPCTLAAFTTSLGLISLYVSNLIPIKKFGLFSAIGTMVTVTLLFTYLPAALKLFPPGYRKRRKRDQSTESSGSLYDMTNAFWSWIGSFVIRRHALVTCGMLLVMGIAALGILKIKTSVQLIKLFDQQSKVVQDYIWMEKHIGKLVPMEIVVGFDREVLDNDEDLVEGAVVNQREIQLKFSRVDRIEAAALIGEELERAFGEQGKGIVGKRLSTEAFLPLGDTRKNKNAELFNKELAKNKEMLLKLGTHGLEFDKEAEKNYGYEFWRISLRLGSGVKTGKNDQSPDVDYGLFVSDLKRVAEPILRAIQCRTEILKDLTDLYELDAEKEGRTLKPSDEMSGRFYMLGFDHGPTPSLPDADLKSFLWKRKYFDQTHVFCRSLYDFMSRRGFSRRGKYRGFDFNNPDRSKLSREDLQKICNEFQCVVLIRDDPSYDIDFLRKNARSFVDARDHRFPADWSNEDIVTFRERRQKLLEEGKLNEAEKIDVVTTYSGIVPIVYKAQRSLLKSLINSICLAFIMIAFVMMLLLRDWKRPPSPGNLINFSGGLISMLPNIFPVILIFGAMGHMGEAVDIGSMMTASVAMGVAVDDTIHFLNWFRKGLRDGLSRIESIRLAYKRCAAAMTQTTLIGGLGLCVFGLSTFTPTQRFGILMLVLLVAALLGDLILLPALLAGPLGKLFTFRENGKKKERVDEPVVISTRDQLDRLDSDRPVEDQDDMPGSNGKQSTPHSGLKDSRKNRPRVDSD